MSQILKIIKYPDKLLRRRSIKVSRLDLKSEKIQQFIDDMIATMLQEDGVGLAAPQVGQNIRIIIITNGKETLPLINPKMIYRSFRKDKMEEGCLSVPGLFGTVKRSVVVYVRSLDRNGEIVKFRAVGLIARICQHEIDHLDGILFIDRAKEVFSIKPAPKL